MKETSTIYSLYFNRKSAIHGRNVHLLASQKHEHRWFVYVCEDTACSLQNVGSTIHVCARWAGTKKACLDKNNTNTGLYKNFVTRCPADLGNGTADMDTGGVVDYVDTSTDQLARSCHQGGAKCWCCECVRLNKL